MHFKSKQEAFTAAVLGLAKQGFMQSRGGTGQCRFRGESGMKCAVGYLVTDEELATLIEASQETTDIVWRLVTIDDIDSPESAESFLLALQTPHDVGDTPEKMKRWLKEFARERGLTFPEDI